MACCSQFSLLVPGDLGRSQQAGQPGLRGDPDTGGEQRSGGACNRELRRLRQYPSRQVVAIRGCDSEPGAFVPVPRLDLDTETGFPVPQILGDGRQGIRLGTTPRREPCQSSSCY